MIDQEFAAQLTAEGLRCHLELPEGAVDPFRILAGLGIAVLRCPLDVEGAYWRIEGQPFASINSLTDITRQRFTAAHELGHHVLFDPDAPPSIVDVDLNEVDEDPAERAVDAFAAAFLMPEAQVRHVAAGAPDATAAIIRTMWHFDVSKPSAAARCLDLGLVIYEQRSAFLKDRRTIPQMFADAGLAPRGRRSMGVREIDPRHIVRVHRLAKAGVLPDTRTFLDLT